MKRIVENGKLIAIVLLLAILVGGYVYVHYSAKVRSTENAYLNASVVEVATQVTGHVTAVYVHENQRVHKGDPLFDIDPVPFGIALARAEADLAQALEAARQDTADVAVARAQIAQDKADLDNARTALARANKLVAQHFLSQQAIDDAQSHVL
jgi:membrane fusion protein (multidrug efflux system)